MSRYISNFISNSIRANNGVLINLLINYYRNSSNFLN